MNTQNMRNIDILNHCTHITTLLLVAQVSVPDVPSRQSSECQVQNNDSKLTSD